MSQLALDLTPKRPPEDAFDVYVAGPQYPEGAGPLPVRASCARAAETIAANIAGVTEDRCLALPATHWSDELVEMLDAAGRRAERELGELKALHAKILGCTVEELETRLAADKAKEAEERAARKAAAPKRERVPRAKSDAIGAARLTERQRELLSNVRVENNLAIYVPEERIPDWAELKRVMLALGGKWKTKTGFVFADDFDAAEAIRLAIDSGEIVDPKAAGFFETPSELADRVVALAKVGPWDLVLEPSAGCGALALAVRRVAPRAAIECIEALPKNVKALKAHCFTVTEADFLSIDPSSTRMFSKVVMNPPFSGQADIDHVAHAMRFLGPGGSLVAIMSAGTVYRQNRKAVEFRALVEGMGGRFESNPDGSFISSGTGVRTVTLVVPEVKRG